MAFPTQQLGCGCGQCGAPNVVCVTAREARALGSAESSELGGSGVIAFFCLLTNPQPEQGTSSSGEGQRELGSLLLLLQAGHAPRALASGRLLWPGRQML